MRRVVKVGGSLLLKRELREMLPAWTEQQTAGETLIVVGGGELVEAIRRLDAIHGGTPSEIHWICVNLLDTTFKIFSRWFDWANIQTADEFQHAVKVGFAQKSPTLVAVSSFYAPELETYAELLPHDWRTTTDSLAALLAVLTDADELVLLKSCPVEPNASIQQLAGRGVVDEALPGFESKLRAIRIEQLK